MKISVNAVFDEKEILFELLDEKVNIQISECLPEIEGIYLFFNKNQLVEVHESGGQNVHFPFDKVVVIGTSQEIEDKFLAMFFRKQQAKLSKKEEHLPENQENQRSELGEKILFVLEKLGIVVKGKKKNAKAQHRFRKEMAETEFFIDARGCKATILWAKRSEVHVKKGALLAKELPLNQDGSIGFSARLGEKIRQDNAEKIQDFQTIDKIILKSMNEVGLLLYFGGANSWLEFKDKDGRTIHERTVVEE